MTIWTVGEARRAEALAAILARQQEAAANIREAAERRRQAEAERLAQLEHRQRRKQEIQVRAGKKTKANMCPKHTNCPQSVHCLLQACMEVKSELIFTSCQQDLNLLTLFVC